MKKNNNFLVTSMLGAVAAILITVMPCSAAMISFSPSASEIGLGTKAFVDVEISGLEVLDLGAFDLTVAYDPEILSSVSFEFPETMGNISDDYALSGFSGGLGEVNFFWVSSLDPSAFIGQANSFSLGEITFKGIESGKTSDLTLSALILGDANGQSISAEAGKGSIHVPEPLSIMLSLTGLIILLGFREFRKKVN